jgi:hypothetical protein
MSAAATAAGYLYASGRLRGRKETDGSDLRADKRESGPAPVKRRQVRIAAIDRDNLLQAPESGSQVEDYPAQPAVRTKPAVRIQYRVRRWRPDEAA